jgi:hypothetical protein
MFSILKGLAEGASRAKEVAKGVASHVQTIQRSVASMYVEGTPVVISLEAKKVIHTPRIIDLTISENAADANAPVTFSVFGCGGDGSMTQVQVANMLNEVAGKVPGPLFVVMLGDNFYDNGVDSENDPAFEKKFYEVYHRPEYPFISNLPYFVILGNHDHNLHINLGLTPGNIHGIIDEKKIAAQVLHTFVHDDKFCYVKDKVHLINLPRWNMPSHFYMLRWQNIEMFFIDSNTYVKDFLAMPQGDEDNQANWLQGHARNPDTIKLIFMHHPLLTVGKRFHHPDTNVYLNPQDIETLKQVYNVEGGYNSILRQVLIDKQGLCFNTVFSAHDHDLFYHLDRENNLCQITVGGGGGALQNRRTAKDWQKMPFFAKSHGIVNVTITPNTLDKKIIFDFHYGLETYRHVRFDNLSLDPHRPLLIDADEEEVAADEFINKLRHVFLCSYEEYMNHAQDRMEGTGEMLNFVEYHGSKGLNSADSLRNLLNNFSPVDPDDIIQMITTTFLERKTQPTPTSLSVIFAANMEKIYKQSFESLVTAYQESVYAREKENSPSTATTPSTVLLSPGLTGSPFVLFGLKSAHGSAPDLLGLGSAASTTPPAQGARSLQFQ